MNTAHLFMILFFQYFHTKALEMPLPQAASLRRCSRLACIAHPPAETRKRFRRRRRELLLLLLRRRRRELLLLLLLRRR